MKCLVFVGALFVFGFGAIAQEASSPAQALEKLEKVWEDLDAFRAVYSGRIPSVQADGRKFIIDSEGKLEMLRHDGALKYRLDQKVTVLNSDGTPQSNSRTVTLHDGARTYVITDVAGSKSVIILSPEGEAGRIPLDGRALLTNLQKMGDMKLAADEVVNGVNTYVFEGTPAATQAPELQGAVTMRVYIDKETGIPLQWVLLDADARAIAEGHYTAVELNPELDPAQFVFEVPVGATVIDTTTAEDPPAANP